jgi:hypothetical protein
MFGQFYNDLAGESGYLNIFLRDTFESPESDLFK